ncbi:hypothetical protein ABZS81_00730 [Streptomyces sp. NPDC005318]|uniref:hypothetical protein n=1 Tax=Streptomyces sp. NPDC005318 TaxID=3157031 RepID=UPI0033A3D049
MSVRDRPFPGEPAFRDPSLAPRWRAARRTVQDHLLQVITESAWGDGDGLILRGSLPLQAWVGAAAREPGDLDWIVLEPSSDQFTDPLDPYPYVAGIDVVQQWPEAADGAAAAEPWTDGECHATGGSRPVPAPEGLRWIDSDAREPSPAPQDEVAAALKAGPPLPRGIRIDPGAVTSDGVWMYREYETPGVRVVVPWQADGVPPGELRMDFAQDERLPEAPVWTACPRVDGGPPLPVRTASPELSLAWKLLARRGPAGRGPVGGQGSVRRGAACGAPADPADAAAAAHGAGAARIRFQPGGGAGLAGELVCVPGGTPVGGRRSRRTADETGACARRSAGSGTGLLMGRSTGELPRPRADVCGGVRHSLPQTWDAWTHSVRYGWTLISPIPVPRPAQCAVDWPD